MAREGVEDEGIRIPAVKELFDEESDLTLKTEIPPRMVMALLRMKVLREAANPRRTKSLMQIFEDEYKKIMVSYKRRGRLELLAALQALTVGEGEEEMHL